MIASHDLFSQSTVLFSPWHLIRGTVACLRDYRTESWASWVGNRVPESREVSFVCLCGLCSALSPRDSEQCPAQSSHSQSYHEVQITECEVGCNVQIRFYFLPFFFATSFHWCDWSEHIRPCVPMALPSVPWFQSTLEQRLQCLGCWAAGLKVKADSKPCGTHSWGVPRSSAIGKTFGGIRALAFPGRVAELYCREGKY